MAEFSKRFTEIFERQPNRLRERFQEFADEQGYVIAEMEDVKKGFSFQVLDKETLTPADKRTHEIFREQFCILDEVVTKDSLHLEEDTDEGIFLWAEPKY